MYLFCSFCMQLPADGKVPMDRRLEAAQAWTVLNGHAVCQRHAEFVQGLGFGAWQVGMDAVEEYEKEVAPHRWVGE